MHGKEAKHEEQKEYKEHEEYEEYMEKKKHKAEGVHKGLLRYNIEKSEDESSVGQLRFDGVEQ